MSTTDQGSMNTESSAQPIKLHREATDSIAETAAIVADEALDQTSETPAVKVTDEESILAGLTEGVRDQEALERDISIQASKALNKQEDERDQKRIEKVLSTKEKLDKQRHLQFQRLSKWAQSSAQRKTVQTEIDRIEGEMLALDKDVADIKRRMVSRHAKQVEAANGEDEGGENKRRADETQRAFLLRTGKITPFSNMANRDMLAQEGDLGDVLMDAEVEGEMAAAEAEEPMSRQNLRLPGFVDEPGSASTSPAGSEFGLRPRKKRRIQKETAVSSASVSEDEYRSEKAHTDASSPGTVSTAETETIGVHKDNRDDDDGNDIIGVDRPRKKPKKGHMKADVVDLSGVDDGDEEVFQARLKSWVDRRSRARNARRNGLERDDQIGEDGVEDEEEEEWFKPSPDAPDHDFDNGLRLPGDVFPALFDYQKTGVQWLSELYHQQVGGIVGDEMGLGKTIQIISFLAGLHYSKKLTQPIIIVAPATVLRQWVNEFHRWWPPLRVSILHTSGSGMLNVANEGRLEDDERYYDRRVKKLPKAHKAAKKIVDRVVSQGHVLVTTYAGLQTYGDLLIPVQWGYAVLDEGHKIRNPNTAITVYCKELQTANRIILSGTPMQNNLVELWSLFDFVYPMRLGTLVNFRQQFEVPIKIGGYANATNLQVLTATKCAETLKDAISPYLLQRFKVDVAADLPKKSEQVLFCKLTKPQRLAYEVFLSSDEMSSILNRTRQSLYGIDILRKICNHPDLLDKKLRSMSGYKWGNPVKSGKMQVVKALVELWKKAGDKILLFSQGVQMLDIIENFMQSMDGVKYLRMDGSTSIKDRQTLVDRFNTDPEIDVFLLTTKVGGLGVNLTGANRVIIFDPDWNPSTDVQARERAWRLGQKKQVTIYRLMTAGTIEEKIYHRQIFKQFLADKILKDPNQRQHFQMKDLYDLFTLGDHEDEDTETGRMFEDTEVRQFDNTPAQPTFTKSHAWGSDTGVPALIAASAPAAETEPTILGPGDPVKEEEDVKGIVGVAGIEQFRGDPADDRPGNEEDRIMEGLFARSGVHSVLQHDKIVNGKKVIQADVGMTEREAKRIAAEAAAELRKAGELAKSTPIGTVTWTGEVGSAGRPPVNVRRAGGPSSSAILSNLAARQGQGQGHAGHRPGHPLNHTSAPPAAGSGRIGGERQSREMMKKIRDYIRIQGGSVPSQMLVVHFGPQTRTHDEAQVFKEMLRQVAVLRHGVGTRGRGKWELKEEFK